MPKILEYLVGYSDTVDSQGDSYGYITLLGPQRTSPGQTGMQMRQAIGVGNLLRVWGGNKTTSPNTHELGAGMWRRRT